MGPSHKNIFVTKDAVQVNIASRGSVIYEEIFVKLMDEALRATADELAMKTVLVDSEIKGYIHQRYEALK